MQRSHSVDDSGNATSFTRGEGNDTATLASTPPFWASWEALVATAIRLENLVRTHLGKGLGRSGIGGAFRLPHSWLGGHAAAPHPATLARRAAQLGCETLEGHLKSYHPAPVACKTETAMLDVRKRDSNNTVLDPDADVMHLKSYATQGHGLAAATARRRGAAGESQPRP
ncbi:unnamed protein product [Prorocentrum cordatum]|uniref:Uncharacterized protein n=1 Tax=Prorocentrum cordatum TaxID=2364126 RepID=A0ABN9WZ02_9DINO|nr:unnamed protein product [Polarella glacialis]